MVMTRGTSPRYNTRMRARAAQKPPLLQPHHEEIAYELTATTQMPGIFLAQNASADAFRGNCGFAHVLLHDHRRRAIWGRAVPDQTGRQSAFGTSRLS